MADADKVKSPILLLVVLMLVSLFLAGGVFYLLQKEKSSNRTLQTELSDLKAQQKIAETKLTESKKTISDLESKLQGAQARIESLTANLAEEKTAKEETLDQIERIKMELEQQTQLRSDLENKLTQTQEDMKNIQSQLNDLTPKKAELETKVKTLEAQLRQAQTNDVELGKIVVAPESSVSVVAAEPQAQADTSQPQGSITRGKVLVVNKDYNFAVVNLGSKDALSEGDLFAVYHEDNYIGDIKIDKIHDSMSAAAFTSADIKDKVSEGDKVIKKTR